MKLFGHVVIARHPFKVTFCPMFWCVATGGVVGPFLCDAHRVVLPLTHHTFPLPFGVISSIMNTFSVLWSCHYCTTVIQGDFLSNSVVCGHRGCCETITVRPLWCEACRVVLSWTNHTFTLPFGVISSIRNTFAVI